MEPCEETFVWKSCLTGVNSALAFSYANALLSNLFRHLTAAKYGLDVAPRAISLTAGCAVENFRLALDVNRVRVIAANS